MSSPTQPPNQPDQPGQPDPTGQPTASGQPPHQPPQAPYAGAPQPPYQPPAGQAPRPPYPPGPPAPPAKPRPSAWWWLGPGLLLLGAVLSLVIGIVVAVQGVKGPTTTVPRDGSAYSVEVDTDRGNTLWAEDGEAVDGCTVVDPTTGQEVLLERVSGEMQFNDMVAMRHFTAESSPVEVTCQPSPAGFDDDPVGVGPRPEWGVFAGGLLFGILGPLVLGLAGGVWGVVLLVLFVTRPSRRAAR